MWEITPAVARQLRLPVDRGLLVVGIDEGGPAAKLGVQLKDVLFQVDRFYVTDLDGLGLILENVRADQAVKIGIVRRNNIQLKPELANDSCYLGKKIISPAFKAFKR